MIISYYTTSTKALFGAGLNRYAMSLLIRQQPPSSLAAEARREKMDSKRRAEISRKPLKLGGGSEGVLGYGDASKYPGRDLLRRAFEVGNSLGDVNCPPTSVLLVLRLKFYTKIFAV